METLSLSAAGFRGLVGCRDCHPDGILDNKGSKVMFTHQIFHFLHVMSNMRYVAAGGGEKGRLT